MVVSGIGANRRDTAGLNLNLRDAYPREVAVGYKLVIIQEVSLIKQVHYHDQDLFQNQLQLHELDHHAKDVL